MITQQRLREVLSYDPVTGVFCWIADKRDTRGRLLFKAGSVVAGKNAAGYIQVKIDQQHFYGHRLAWLYVYGEIPNGQIDHVNGDPSDNRISNLRIATYTQQRGNQKLRKDSSTGVKGVYLHKSGLYCARCIRKGMPTFSAYFRSLDDAAAAYADAAKRMHGEFARLA